MRIGIHLPQYGKVIGRDNLVEAARAAEAMGFADVWVSDHVVHPAEQGYPAPYLLDPLTTLTWAAASTERIGLGTSVWVAPMHEALESANAFASLDVLSGGRLTIGVGVGWSEREYQALGRDFGDRGARADEIIDVWRAAWGEDPASFHGDHHDFTDIRVLPRPERRIPIWVGAGSEPGYRRAVERADGFQLLGLDPEAARPVVERLRRDRPDPDDFTISLRTGWDPNGMDPDVIRAEHDAYAEAGVQHVVSAPWRTDVESWLDSMARLAELTGLG